MFLWRRNRAHPQGGCPCCLQTELPARRGRPRLCPGGSQFAGRGNELAIVSLANELADQGGSKAKRDQEATS
jgi:hypothetical protein